MAIEKGNSFAMNNFAIYHKNITKNYVEMKKYYLMAIEKGNSDAMNSFALCHKNITKNYIEMEKYYLMAIEKGNTFAMQNLAYYHKSITKNYVEMEKYYLMAIEKGNSDAMNNFASYHEIITKNYIEMEKYYLMAIEKGNYDKFNYLVTYYETNKFYVQLLQLYVNNSNHIERDDIIQQFNLVSSIHLDKINKEIFFQLLINFEFICDDKLGSALELLLSIYKNNVSIIDLHFKYTIHSKGFEDAKLDYFSKCLENNHT
jgi:TPR repeat protein